MNDNYSHIENGIFYIVENIIGPVEQNLEYKQMLNDFHSQLIYRCECVDTCSVPSCACLRISGGNNYIAADKDSHAQYTLNNKTDPLIECNDNCPCSEYCGNRVVQRGPIDGLEIRMCDVKAKGFGLFSTIFIPKGTFICEYAGELITKLEAGKRHERNKLNGKMNYIFCLNEHSNGGVVQTFVDPSSFGNIGRYINHSCNPNCYIVPVRYHAPIPKLGIFTHMDILPSEEITFHYGSNVNNAGDASSNRIQCYCNSPKCTGLMPYDMY